MAKAKPFFLSREASQPNEQVMGKACVEGREDWVLPKRNGAQTVNSPPLKKICHCYQWVKLLLGIQICDGILREKHLLIIKD